MVWRRYRILITILFSSTLILCGSGFYLWCNSQIIDQQSENNELKSKINSQTLELELYNPGQMMEMEVFQKERQVDMIAKPVVSHAYIYTEVQRIIPAQILITEMEIKESKVKILGFCPDHHYVASFIQALNSISTLGNVSLVSSIMNENLDQVKFNIEIEWE